MQPKFENGDEVVFNDIFLNLSSNEQWCEKNKVFDKKITVVNNVYSEDYILIRVGVMEYRCKEEWLDLVKKPDIEDWL